MLRLAIIPKVAPGILRNCLHPEKHVVSFSSEVNNGYSEEALNRQAKYANVVRYIDAYREWGHLRAQVNPLEDGPLKEEPLKQLEPSYYRLQDTDSFPTEGIVSSPKKSMTISELTRFLAQVYSQSISYEFSHCATLKERKWFADIAEKHTIAPTVSPDERQRAIQLMTYSEVFDQFMTKRFPTVKRYSLEGMESMLPLMDALLRHASQNGIQQAVIGLPHRGRLNVLTELLHFPHTAIFRKCQGHSEFHPTLSDKNHDSPSVPFFSGDVLAHLYHSVDLSYDQDRSLHVSLLPNPSHLEAIHPVAMGLARFKHHHHLSTTRQHSAPALCILQHGDAAFTGQGVVMESLTLSQLPGYTVDGCIHLIVNNQLGFTAQPSETRSTRYASDVAHMIHAPVIHVHAERLDHVLLAASLAVAYRQQFHKDIVVDLVGYRRWGHNELDEPSYTQPHMYDVIRHHRTSYPSQLNAPASELRTHRWAHLDAQLALTAQEKQCVSPVRPFQGAHWEGMRAAHSLHEQQQFTVTGVSSIDVLQEIGRASVQVPSADFHWHPRLDKSHRQPRLGMMAHGKGVDWSTAEALAFGSLLREGVSVRLTGQDVARGTFSQRHAAITDQVTHERVIPLAAKNRMEEGSFELVNSPLSEMACVGFEYGFSLGSPRWLTVWEAQFGDFVNGAQIMLDQFIATGETKWMKQSGLVLLLPHGMDGTGPEHSSCKLERHLLLSDDSGEGRPVNWHIVQCTTPAQYFHVLRRQMNRAFRKPLVVVSPKVLLRLPEAVSTLNEMVGETGFQAVLEEPDAANKGDDGWRESIHRLVFCSGKIYYDLVKERQERQIKGVAFVRLEELSPFPYAWVSKTLSLYPNVQEYYWCQEEHKNQGSYPYVAPRLSSLIPSKLVYVGRDPLAASAVGIHKLHNAEVQKIWTDVFS